MLNFYSIINLILIFLTFKYVTKYLNLSKFQYILFFIISSIFFISLINFEHIFSNFDKPIEQINNLKDVFLYYGTVWIIEEIYKLFFLIIFLFCFKPFIFRIRFNEIIIIWILTIASFAFTENILYLENMHAWQKSLISYLNVEKEEKKFNKATSPDFQKYLWEKIIEYKNENLSDKEISLKLNSLTYENYKDERMWKSVYVFMGRIVFSTTIHLISSMLVIFWLYLLLNKLYSWIMYIWFWIIVHTIYNILQTLTEEKWNLVWIWTPLIFTVILAFIVYMIYENFNYKFN